VLLSLFARFHHAALGLEKGWECMQVFEGHTHYVMQVEFNPKDSNTFASASLDRTVKIWGLNSPNPHFSLEGHERGVNCIGYYRGGERPYLVSGADDHTIKIWDYQTKSCVATLEGHTNNISSVCFHPQLPIILSGSEDGTVRIWHSNTYRLENTLNYGMERVWTICCLKGSNKVAIGYDDGTIMIKIGHEEPVASMEKAGKLVWANNQEILTSNLKTSGKDAAIADGDRLPVTSKELGACELYPQALIHSPNGRLICACGDGEYIIYTALSLKNSSFGSALEFVWAEEAGVYATRETSSKIKVFKNFKESKSFRPNFAAEGIFGGALLGVRSADFVDFYDWDECRIVRRIDVVPRKVFWSESGELVVLACDASFYVLRYNKELVTKFQEQAVEVSEQGIEGSFDLEQEVAEKVRNGCFCGDIFIYTNTAGRLNYYVGGEVITLAHLNKPMHLLGYLPKENRVYLMDKQHQVFAYNLLLSVLVYQTAIVRRDFDSATKALAAIPQDQMNKIARFLENQDLKDMALEVTQDPEHKFELAMAVKKFRLAREILLQGDAASAAQDSAAAAAAAAGGVPPPSADSEQKWKLLGDAALSQSNTRPEDFDLSLALESYTRAKDLGGLLLIYSSLGDAAGMEKLAAQAESEGRNNIAFLCHFLLGPSIARKEQAIRILVESDRIPEAAFLARTYLPSRISKILALWKDNLSKISVKAAEALADPVDYAELFPDLPAAVEVEKWVAANEGSELLPSMLYGDYSGNLNRNLISDLKEGKIQPVSAEEARKLEAAQPPQTQLESSRPTPTQPQAAPLAPKPAPQQEEVKEAPKPPTAAPVPAATAPKPTAPVATPATPAPATSAPTSASAPKPFVAPSSAAPAPLSTVSPASATSVVTPSSTTSTGTPASARSAAPTSTTPKAATATAAPTPTTTAAKPTAAAPPATAAPAKPASVAAA
jgi:coatomer subunit beta'